MVTETEGRDRAQLILVGCVAIAFVIISLGLLINTTIYTESSSQALSNAQVDSATSLDLETRRGARSIIHRANLGPRDRNEPALEDDVSSTMDNYSVLLGEQYARSRAATVSVDYSPTHSEIGTRVVQSGDGDFYEGFELDPNVDQRLGWFVINANASETAEGESSPFMLTVANGSDQLEVDIYRNESVSGSEPHVTVETRLSSGGHPRNVTCDPRRNRVVFDVVSGETIADACPGATSLYSLSDLDPPITSIDPSTNPHKFDGTWEFVTNASNSVDAASGSDFDCTASPPDDPASDEACRSPVVWTANVTTAFDSDGATFHRNRSVTIYGGDL